MEREGPPLEALTRRLAETPADFLAEPRIGAAGIVNVAAVVSDVLFDLNLGPLADEQASAFTATDARAHRNRLSLALIAAWLLRDDAFRTALTALPAPEARAAALGLLGDQVTSLAALAQAPRFVNDPDRREELVRFALRAAGLRPAGESVEQAQDRLANLNSAERQRVIEAARAAEARARSIREALAAKAAEEAAAKYNRE